MVLTKHKRTPLAKSDIFTGEKKHNQVFISPPNLLITSGLVQVSIFQIRHFSSVKKSIDGSPLLSQMHLTSGASHSKKRTDRFSS